MSRNQGTTHCIAIHDLIKIFHRGQSPRKYQVKKHKQLGFSMEINTFYKQERYLISTSLGVYSNWAVWQLNLFP